MNSLYELTGEYADLLKAEDRSYIIAEIKLREKKKQEADTCPCKRCSYHTSGCRKSNSCSSTWQSPQEPMLELLAALPGQMVRTHMVCEIAGEQYAAMICKAGGNT